MDLEIKKEDLEQAVPVSTSSHDEVFNMTLPSFDYSKDYCESNILGEKIADSIADKANILSSVKRFVCIHAFLGVFRHFDLVLNASGFGIVSNDNLAPASQARVDAMEKQLKIELELTKCRLISLLTKETGWSDTIQARLMIPNIFYNFNYMSMYASFPSVTQNDWISAQIQIQDACNFLIKHIGQQFMEEILKQLRSHNLSTDYIEPLHIMLLFVGAWLSSNKTAMHSNYDKVIAILESNSTAYKLYFDSDAYKLNHFLVYENTKEAGTYYWG